MLKNIFFKKLRSLALQKFRGLYFRTGRKNQKSIRQKSKIQHIQEIRQWKAKPTITDSFRVKQKQQQQKASFQRLLLHLVCPKFLFGKGFQPFISRCCIALWMPVALCSVLDVKCVDMVWNSGHGISELVNSTLQSAWCQQSPKFTTTSICLFSQFEFFRLQCYLKEALIYS